MAVRRSRGPRPSTKREERAHRINLEIRAPKVRLVNTEALTELYGDLGDGVVSLSEALKMAEETQMDLVEITAKADPPVCRIVEYSKFNYELKKREKVNKSKQHKVEMKEIRFGPNTDEHDFNFKLKHAEKFLQDGNKLKAYVHFRGRMIVYKDRGKDVLDRFAEQLADVGKVEMEAKMEGRRMIMILSPKKGPGK
ncbi:MAG: translation initiation factor IF-3 [Bacteroidia bacterium]|nr:translation initiation factor IF-3 [Bacteroidia bacterium]